MQGGGNHHAVVNFGICDTAEHCDTDFFSQSHDVHCMFKQTAIFAEVVSPGRRGGVEPQIIHEVKQVFHSFTLCL